jgi:hypothetical protein
VPSDGQSLTLLTSRRLVCRLRRAAARHQGTGNSSPLTGTHALKPQYDGNNESTSGQVQPVHWQDDNGCPLGWPHRTHAQLHSALRSAPLGHLPFGLVWARLRSPAAGPKRTPSGWQTIAYGVGPICLHQHCLGSSGVIPATHVNTHMHCMQYYITIIQQKPIFRSNVRLIGVRHSCPGLKPLPYPPPRICLDTRAIHLRVYLQHYPRCSTAQTGVPLPLGPAARHCQLPLTRSTTTHPRPVRSPAGWPSPAHTDRP